MPYIRSACQGAAAYPGDENGYLITLVMRIFDSDKPDKVPNRTPNISRPHEQDGGPKDNYHS